MKRIHEPGANTPAPSPPRSGGEGWGEVGNISQSQKLVSRLKAREFLWLNSLAIRWGEGRGEGALIKAGEVSPANILSHATPKTS